MDGVEHEVAQAVEDGGGPDAVCGLRHVRMMADDGIGPGLGQQTGVITLLHVGDGLELRPPVQDGHHAGTGMRGLVFPDGGGQPADGHAADVRFAFRLRPVLYREGDGVE